MRNANIILAKAVLTAVLLLQGMPVGRSLFMHERSVASQKYASAIDSAASAGIENTLIVAFIWGTLYSFATLLVLRHHKNILLSSIKIYWPLSILLILAFISASWVIDITPVLMNSVHFIGIYFIALCVPILYNNNYYKFTQHISFILGINIFIHIISIYMYPGYAIGYDGRWVGLTTNSNTLGLLSAITIFATSLSILSNSKKKFITIIFYYIIMILSCVSLYFTQSATAGISVLIALFVSVLHKYKIKYFLTNMIIIIFIVVISLYYNDIVTIVGSNISYLFNKSSNFTGRMYLWSLGIDLFLDRPILGWGYDNHYTVLSTTIIPTMHLHNGYIDLMVKGGILAMFLYVMYSYKTILNITKKSHNSYVLYGFIIFILVYNLSEVSIMQSRNLLWMLNIAVSLLAIPNKSNTRY